MLRLIAKRVAVLLLVVVMLLGMAPSIQWETKDGEHHYVENPLLLAAWAAASYSKTYSSLNISVATSDSNGTYTETSNGFTVTVEPSSSTSCGSTTYSAQSSSITVTNKAAYTSTISYTITANSGNSGSVSPSAGTATKELAPNGTFTITFTSGKAQNANANYTVTFNSNTIKPVTASASVNDSSMGTATVSSASVTPGSSVTWTASAKADHEFLYWQDGSSQVTTNPYTKTITANTTLTAYFRSTDATVYFANQTGGSYTVTGTGINTSVTTSTQTVKKNENLSVSLTATEDSGYRFAGWYKGDTQLSAANPWSLTLKDYDGQTITAHWEDTNVTTTFVPSEGGSYTIGGTAITASTPISANYTVEFTWVATPATDYHFVRWLDQTLNVTLSTDATTTRTLNETAGHTVTAEFAYDYITQTFPAVTGGAYSIEGHSVSGSNYNFTGRYDQDYTVTIGTLQEWYRFDGWEDGSGVLLADSTHTSYSFRLSVGGTVKPRITFYGLNVTFQSATIGGTYTFTAPNSDPVTVDSSDYSYLGDATKNYTLTATPDDDSPYVFIAWKDVTANSNLSTANPYVGTLTNGHTYMAVFGRTDTAQYKVGSNTYDYLDEAITAAGSSGKIIVVESGVVAGSTGQTSFTIPSGVTMVVPYDDAGSVPSASSYKPTFTSAGNDGYVKPTLFKKLTMLGGTTITVNGLLCVNSKMSRGNGGANYSGASSGPYGQLAMESGSSVIVNGTLVCYGYITGTGTVTANSGATVFEGFQVLDTPGGSHLRALNGNSNGAFLFNQYTVQNVEVPMEIKAGATEKVWTGMYPSTSLEGDATLIGSSAGLFRITSGSVVKSYLPAEDRLQFDMFGNVTLGSITLSISSYDMDTTNYNLPISPRINIFVRSGNATISGHTVLLPDSKMAIDEGATFTLNNGKRLLVYDIDDWDSSKFFYAQLATQVKSVAYSPTTGTPAAHAPTRSAEINVNGLLQVTDGYLYTSSHGANVYSGDRTGKTIIQTAYGDYTLKQCTGYSGSSWSSSATYQDVAFTSAQLKNGQPYEGTEKEHIKTGNGSGGTGTFWYTAPTDQWYKFTVDYKYNGNTIFTDYIFDGTSSYTVSGLEGLGASASVGTATVSGETISVTGVTANSTVTVTGTPKEYRPYFVLDAKNYGLYQRFTGGTLSDTVTVGDATYYVVQAAEGNLAFGSALSAPSDASMGVSAANYNEITWRLADNAAAAVFPGSVPQGEVAQGPVYIYGFYSGYVASVTESGTTKYYTTLEKAFYTLLNNKTYTVTMLADCDSYEDEDGTASLSVPAGSTVTFDMNGHYAKGKLVNNDTMYLELNGGTFEFQTDAAAASASWKGVAAIMNSGTLVITDSVGGGMITTDAISDTSGTNGSAVIRNNATGILTITGQANNLLKIHQAQNVNTNNYGIYNLGTINALTNVDIYTKNSGTCGLNIYNYNTGVIKLISGGHFFTNGSVSFFNYGGTINTIDGVTVDGKKGLQNQNIRTGAIASGYVVADADKAIVDIIKNSHFEVGQYAINNSATINTLLNSTFIAAPDTAQCDTRGNGLSTASEGNVAAYTVYNTANWWYDTNVWKQVDSTSGGYFRTNYYKEEEAYRPTIGQIIDCEIYAENTTTSASYGDYALVNSGGVIGKIGGTTNIKTYKHPDSTATITTSHYAMQNLAGGIIKSIEGTVNISATGIDALQNTGIFTTQIAYTYGNKVGGNVTHQVSTYGDPSTILSVTCAGTWSCGSYYVILNSGYIQTIDAPDLTLKSATSGYNVLYNYMDGANSSLDYYCYYTDNATAGTAYLREATYVRNLEKGGTIGTINGVTIQGKYSVLVNLGHIGTLSNVTVSTLTSSNDPTIVNGDNRVSGVTEIRKDVAHYSSDYPHVTVSAGYATRYDREWTYVPATIDVIDNLTLTSTGQYALRNAGHIGTLKNSTITATTNYALHNSASGPFTEKQSVQYYSGTSVFATTKSTSEYSKHYERDPATIDLIDNCTIKTNTSTYAALNVGHIGTIKNSTFQAGATTAAQYALANFNSQEREYTRNLEEVMYITANGGTACTAFFGTGGETNTVVYDYDQPSIDLIGEGNTFLATTTVIANSGIITEINSGTGTPTTITASSQKGSAIYNYGACLDARTTTTPYTAAASAGASGTAGTAVNDDTLLAGAQIGTIKNVYIDANGYGILNGDAAAGKTPTIGEIGEGTEIYAHCTTKAYHAIANQNYAEITKITGGIFKVTAGDASTPTNAYRNGYNVEGNAEHATVISGGYFQGMPNNRDNAIFKPDNTDRQTYPEGKKLSTGTEDPTEVNANMSGTYYYIADTYTVTFDMQDHGTAPDDQTVESGLKATKPTDPTEEGYTFGGWYTDTNFSDEFDFTKAITPENFTVTEGIVTAYAKWTELPNVARIGETGYKSLTAAITAAQNGDTIVLLANITGQYTIPSGKTLTLDLNGHTIDYHTGATAAAATYNSAATITNFGTLTITDSATGGKITTDACATASSGNTQYVAAIRNESGAHLTVAGGELKTTHSVEGNYACASILNLSGATVDEISGGTLDPAKGYPVFNNGTITLISGGTFHGTNGHGIHNAGTIATISGGEFQSDNYSGVNNKGTINAITGGTFTGGVDSNNTVWAGFYTRSGSSGTTTISGGYFKGGGTNPTRDDAIKVESGGASITYPTGKGLSTVTTTAPNVGTGYYTIVNFWTVSFNMQGHGDAPANQTVENTLKATEPAAPTADGYTFDGWYKEDTCTNAWNFSTNTVTADTTLYAKWTINTYTITWKNDDGTTIGTTTVEHGTVPTHADATKAETDEYTYSFDRWDPTPVAATADATYTASFTQTKKSYTITWNNDDGRLIDTTTVEYGATPTHADVTKAADAQYTYTFAGWNPEIVDVTGPATYTAIFTATPKHVHSQNLTEHEAVSATCTTAGSSAYWSCECGKYFSDENAENEIEENSWVLPALGHDLIHHEAQAATCTAIGWNTYDTCSRCDYTTYVEIPALGHDWDVSWTWDGVESAAATFVCKRNDEHTETINATITCSPKTESVDTYTASVTFDGTTYTDSKDVGFIARIGDVHYASLKAAVAAAEDGDTIYLVADDDVSLTDGSELVINKSLTITGEVDENGDPITKEDGSFFTIYGTSSQTGYNDIFITGSGTVTISNLNIRGFGNNAATDIGHAPIYVSSNFSGTVNLEGLYISDFNRGGIFLYGNECEFNVVDCDINCANSRSGAFTKGIEIKNGASGTIENTWIYNMERSSTDYSSAGIEVYGYGDVTVDGCWIMSNEDEGHSTAKATYGIVVGAVGAYDPAGGTLTVTDTTTNTTNAALSVDAGSYEVELTDNSFDNYMATWNAGSTVTVNSGEYAEDVYADAGTITIHGGNFTNFAPDTGANGSIVIDGGIFDTEVPEEYCAEDLIPVDYDVEAELYTVGAGWFVTFVNDDGTTELLRKGFVADATPYYTGETPTKAATAEFSYTFAGWSTDGETVLETLPEVTEEATYIAVFTPVKNSYTVTFIVSDGSSVTGYEPITRTVLYGNKATAPSRNDPGDEEPSADKLPLIEGKAVEGWYTSTEYTEGTEWRFSTDVVTGNRTLYAKWVTAAEATVTYTLVQTGDDATTYESETFIYIPEEGLQTPEYMYYTFTGWTYDNVPYETSEELEAVLNAKMQDAEQPVTSFEVTANFERESYSVKMYSWIDGYDDKPYDEGVAGVTNKLGGSVQVTTSATAGSYYFQYWLIVPESEVANMHQDAESRMLVCGDYEEYRTAKSVFFAPKAGHYCAVAFYKQGQPDYDVNYPVSLRITNESNQKVGKQCHVAVTLEVSGLTKGYTLTEAGLWFVEAESADGIETKFNKRIQPRLKELVDMDPRGGATHTMRWTLDNASKNLYLYAYAIYKEPGGTEKTLYYAYSTKKMTETPGAYDVITFLD